MYHKQLVTHINSRKSVGVSDEDIKKELLQDGWGNEDVEQAFYYVQFPNELSHFSLPRILKSEVKESTFLLTVVTGLVACLVFFFYFRNETVSYALVAPVAPLPDKIVFSYGVQPSLSNPDFFAKVRSQFVSEKVTFVEVDLSQMVARVYKDGVSILEVPVKTKGKEGSWWETPAGLYKIETKEKTHYSTMGHVTQPWSMEFQGNFFIHGIPYYPDGTKVSSTFSGGCIRLEDEDAKKIFNEVSVGTPILVYEKDFIPDTFSYKESKPNIQASSFMVADILNNHVFLKNNETQQISTDFITKFMTALVATEYINIERTTIVSKDSLVETSTPRLRAGMKIDIYQLLFPLLRESSNEAAEAIARSYGRSEFIKHMNEKAKSIGMNNTIFVDPSGTSLENVSTTEDIFMLAKYIYNNRSFIFNITSGKVKTNTYGESIFSDLRNANELINQGFFFGGMSDKLSNGNEYNLSIFELSLNGGTRPIFLMTVNSKDSKADILNGLKYLTDNYH